jgi:hypothetical protein
MFPIHVRDEEEPQQQLAYHFINGLGHSLLDDSSRLPLLNAPQEVPGVKKAPKTLIITDVGKIEKLKAQGSAAKSERADVLERRLKEEGYTAPVTPGVVVASHRYWRVELPPMFVYMYSKNKAAMKLATRYLTVDLAALHSNKLLRAWLQNTDNITGNFYCLYDFHLRVGYNNKRRTELDKLVAELLLDYFSPSYIFTQVYLNPTMRLPRRY